MSKLKKIIYFVSFFFITLIIYIFLISDKLLNNSTKMSFNLRNVANSVQMKFKKNLFLPKQSYYKLDEMKFFAISSDKKLTYVETIISLAYPMNSSEYEYDIINHRDQIKKCIKNFLSQKTFNQLNSSNYRENYKDVIVNKINKILTYPIINIYFLNFFLIQRPKIELEN